jgi:hypothetical protein
MAYPTIDKPYGFKPINLIGGQVFAGSTRNLPIQYSYATNIFYGDFVVLASGFVTRATVTTGAGLNQVVGVFLGCSYTDPTTKQKRFSQYWPAGTLAGDAVAVICDDPDTVFKAVMVTTQGGTTVGSASLRIIGSNLNASDLAGSTATGNSFNGILAATTTPVTTTLPIRIVDVVRDTAVSVTATGASSSTTITLSGTGLPSAIVSGTDVAYIAANGQLIQTGSYVNNASGYAAGSTSITINAAIAVPAGSLTAIPSASTIVFTQYPEVLCKIQFGAHGYYSATGT